MKILIVNTSDKVGGAAIAANRLMKSLKDEGTEVKMLVLNKVSDNPDVIGIHGTFRKKYAFLMERLVIWITNLFSRKNLFTVSVANTGISITQLPEFREADVIHLHWFNQGMLSLSELDKILHSGKKVFWTMHDTWSFTGICHYSGDCTEFRNHCHHCPLLASPSAKDLSYRTFSKKQKIYSNSGVTLIGCSQWIAALACRSRLAYGLRVVSIPNPIDTDLFCPKDKLEVRTRLHLPLDKKLLLFGSQRITDERKGISYLVEACNILVRQYPELKDLGLIVLGSHTEEIKDKLPLPVYSMNYVSEESELAEIYNSADVFVTPSLQDNLPNTIMESLSCGVPCVGFRVGGIPEMISHKENGYVAQYKSSEDLAEGIHWVLQEADIRQLSSNARNKVIENYSMPVVARQFMKLYQGEA